MHRICPEAAVNPHDAKQGIGSPLVTRQQLPLHQAKPVEAIERGERGIGRHGGEVGVNECALASTKVHL